MAKRRERVIVLTEAIVKVNPGGVVIWPCEEKDNRVPKPIHLSEAQLRTLLDALVNERTLAAQPAPWPKVAGDPE